MASGYIIQRKKTDRAFQFSVELNVKYNLANTVWYNSKLIYDWLKSKYIKVCKLPYNIPPLWSKEKLDIFYEKERHFCCRFEHSDSKIQGREWITEVEVISRDEKVLLGIKVSYTTPEEADFDRNIFSVPKIVWEILKKNGFKDIRELKKSILEADTEEKLNELYDLIADKNRLFPVIVVTNSKDDVDNWSKSRLFAEGLLYRLGLIAHIAYIPCEMCLRWKELVGEGWDVYNGAVRTYYESVDFASYNFYEHPLFTAKRILISEFTVQEKKTGKEKILAGYDAFFEFICSKIQSNDTHMRIDWRGRGHKFFNAANDAAQNARLRLKEDQIGDEWLKIYEHDKAEWQNELDAALEEIERLEKLLKEERKIRMNVENYKEILLARLAEEGKSVEIIPENCTYEKLPEWITTYFSDKIVLSKRAERSLKNARFEDVRLVFEAVKLLGTEYCKMKAGLIERADFESKCSELYLQETATISDNRAGEKDDTYYLKDENGRRRKLERHLKKGSDREEKYCLRIYFYWDDDSNKVVIGDLPGHLETRAT